MAALVGAGLIGIDTADALVGLALLPAVVVGLLLIRGWHAPPLRVTGAACCGLNLAIGVVVFSWVPVAALLFVGAALLLAAARGDGGCEVLAVSNSIRGRDDRIACPVFSPIDAAESRAGRAAR